MKNPNVLEKFQHVLALPDAERIQFIDEPRWITYPAAKEIMETLQTLIRKPKKPRMDNLLIVGDSNNGKTTIIRRFKDICANDSTLESVSQMPVLVAEAPPTADEKGLHVSILERFFTPYRITNTTMQLRFQVIHMCRELNVRMLIIDEFHSMLTGTPKKQREVMNSIKLLCNELNIPIVGVGTQDAVRVLHTDSQHSSRFSIITLPQWKEDKSFQVFLRSIEAVLPLRQPSNIHEPESAALLYNISEGNTGNLHKLVSACAVSAIKSGKECIDAELIRKYTHICPTRGARELIK